MRGWVFHWQALMEIDCIGCLHGDYPQLEGGDLLIVTGDLTARDALIEHVLVTDWMHEQKYKMVVFIAGNHDGRVGDIPRTCDHVHYLCDSGAEFGGLKIWGSPWTPEFCNWHFMKKRGSEMKAVWDRIPTDIDILVTHGPPYQILDKAEDGSEVGCMDLRNWLKDNNPKLHAFSHIHGAYGEVKTDTTHFVNCSYVNERYKPVNKPIRVIL